MHFETRCPHCGDAARTSSMYAGTKRRCRACGELFLLELPSEVRAVLEEKRSKKPSATSVMVMCEVCLESFVAPIGPDGAPAAELGDPHRTSAVVRCRCGGSCAPAPVVRAKLDGSQKAAISALLVGERPEHALAMITDAGWTPPVASRLLSRCLRDLPFVRAHLWQAVLDGALELRMAPPRRCDLCVERPLADQRPLDATWRRVTRGDTTLSPWSALTLFGGAILFEREVMTETLRALYFLCAHCHGELKRLFRTYAGYPANVGYRLDELRKL